MTDENLQQLMKLEGEWKGRGAGRYPTIDSFEYDETIRFDPDASYPLIHYEQRTWLTSGEASHWESGFIRPLEDGAIDVSNSQDSGRVEVLRGRLSPADGGFVLALESVVLDHDPRLVRTRRTFTLNDDTLRYLVEMATHTTPEPRMQQHLEAVLTRQA